MKMNEALKTSLQGAAVVACAIILDALRRVRAAGPDGMWFDELAWHLKPWGVDAAEQVVGSHGKLFDVRPDWGLGINLRSLADVDERINALEQIEGVRQLVEHTTGLLPNRSECGERLLNAFRDAMRARATLMAEHGKEGHTYAERAAHLQPLIDLLAPLFGGMILGHGFDSRGHAGIGFDFYAKDEHVYGGPFASLKVRFDLDDNQIWVMSGLGEGPEVLLDASVTLGTLEQLCRRGGWAAHRWEDCPNYKRASVGLAPLEKLPRPIAALDAGHPDNDWVF